MEEQVVPKPIGVTIHHDDKSILKVPITDLAAAMQALLMTHGRGGKNNYINADECPVHGPWRGVPAGVSKSSGKPYNAFYACDQEQGEERCTNRPAKEWVETHPVGGVAPDQAPTAEPSGPASDTDEYDSLPF